MATIARASQITKGLEVIFRNGPKQDADTVAIWKNAKRVGPRRLRLAAVPLPAPAPAPAPPSDTKAA